MPELWRACGCHSCPSLDAERLWPETLCPEDAGTSGTLDGDGVDNIGLSPYPLAHPAPRTVSSSRSACSRASSSRIALSLWADPAASDLTPESGSSHPHRAQSPARGGSDKDRPHLLASPRIPGLVTV